MIQSFSEKTPFLNQKSFSVGNLLQKLGVIQYECRRELRLNEVDGKSRMKTEGSYWLVLEVSS